MNAIGDTSIEVAVGDMGIKTICVGDEVIYERMGGVIYITLCTTESEE